jgi:hypothetical protein
MVHGRKMEASVSESGISELAALATLLNTAYMPAPARSFSPSASKVNDLLRFRGGSNTKMVLDWDNSGSYSLDKSGKKQKVVQSSDKRGSYNLGVDFEDTVDDDDGKFHAVVSLDGWEAELAKKYPERTYRGFTPSASYKFNEDGVKVKAQVDGKLADKVSAQYAIGTNKHAKKYSSDDLVHSGKLVFSSDDGNDKLELLGSYSQGSKKFKPSVKSSSKNTWGLPMEASVDGDRVEVGATLDDLSLKYGYTTPWLKGGSQVTQNQDIALTLTKEGNKFGGKVDVIDGKPHLSLDAEVTQKGNKYKGEVDFKNGIRKPRLSLSTSVR